MKINMTALRVAVFSSFVLTVAATVLMLILPLRDQSMQNQQEKDSAVSPSPVQDHSSHSTHAAQGEMQDDAQGSYDHLLHIAHVVLASLTFLLIFIYLSKSAEIASLKFHRELRLRMTVDPGAGFIEHMETGLPVYNACAGALAKNGIFVKNASSMRSLSKQRVIAAEGNSESRDGYAATKSTLAEMGITLSDDTNECPVKLVLGAFDRAHASSADFVLTNDKVAYILAAVFVSRVYARYTLCTRALLIAALVLAAALVVFGQVMYSVASLAVWSACEVILIRQIEKKTTRLTFDAIKSYYRVPKAK